MDVENRSYLKKSVHLLHLLDKISVGMRLKKTFAHEIRQVKVPQLALSPTAQRLGPNP